MYKAWKYIVPCKYPLYQMLQVQSQSWHPHSQKAKSNCVKKRKKKK